MVFMGLPPQEGFGCLGKEPQANSNTNRWLLNICARIRYASAFGGFSLTESFASKVGLLHGQFSASLSGFSKVFYGFSFPSFCWIF